jgi:hypothetical protein
MTIPPIRADASILRPITPQPCARAAECAAVEVKTLPALSSLLSHSPDVRDLCKTVSQQARAMGGALALAEVMTGRVPVGDSPRTAVA